MFIFEIVYLQRFFFKLQLHLNIFKYCFCMVANTYVKVKEKIGWVNNENYVQELPYQFFLKYAVKNIQGVSKYEMSTFFSRYRGLKENGTLKNIQPVNLVQL